MQRRLNTLRIKILKNLAALPSNPVIVNTCPNQYFSWLRSPVCFDSAANDLEPKNLQHYKAEPSQINQNNLICGQKAQLTALDLLHVIYYVLVLQCVHYAMCGS